MSKRTVITAENFKAQLSVVVKADRSLRTQVQDLIVFGFREYADNQNSNWLSDLIVADLRGMRTKAIQEYIEENTDLVLTKMKDGEARFKREAREGFEFAMPTVPWYEYSNAGKVSVIDPVISLNSLIRKLEHAESTEDDKKVLKDGTKVQADEMLVYLKACPVLNQVAV
jgi:hypothetical protein